MFTYLVNVSTRYIIRNRYLITTIVGGGIMPRLNKDTALEVLDVVRGLLPITLEELLKKEGEELTASEKNLFADFPEVPNPLPDDTYKVTLSGRFKVYFIFIPDKEYKAEEYENYPAWVVEFIPGNKKRKK